MTETKAGVLVHLPRSWHRDAVLREEVFRQIRQAYNEGRSDQEIALRVGCSARTVLRFRETNSLPPNTYGGRPLGFSPGRGSLIA